VQASSKSGDPFVTRFLFGPPMGLFCAYSIAQPVRLLLPCAAVAVLFALGRSGMLRASGHVLAWVRRLDLISGHLAHLTVLGWIIQLLNRNCGVQVVLADVIALMISEAAWLLAPSLVDHYANAARIACFVAMLVAAIPGAALTG
jgi:hypothetical protein